MYGKQLCFNKKIYLVPLRNTNSIILQRGKKHTNKVYSVTLALY